MVPPFRRSLARVVLSACAAVASVAVATARARTALAADPPAPDYAFYKERVAPIVHRVCADCHADPRKRLGKHFLRPRKEQPVRERDHRANFETILGLITPGDPSKSPWILKPLTERQGGVAHKGGEKIRFDSLEYATMVRFVNGDRIEATTAPVIDAEEVRGPADVPPEGLTLQAEWMDRDGVPALSEPEEAEGQVVGPGPGGITLRRRVRVADEGLFELSFRARGPGGFTTSLGEGRPFQVDMPAGEGFLAVGPSVPFDGKEPLGALRGDLVVREGALEMTGRPDAPASWLAASDVSHDAVEADVELPDEEEGGEDVVLLFDMADADDGRYLALVDGGRRLVLGVVEGGTFRAVDAKEAPRAEGKRTLRAEALDGLVVGRLDGKALVRAPVNDRDDRGRVGLLTHGVVRASRVAQIRQFEVHRVRFEGRPVVRLSAGEHDLRVELPTGGPSIDLLTIRRFAP